MALFVDQLLQSQRVYFLIELLLMTQQQIKCLELLSTLRLIEQMAIQIIRICMLLMLGMVKKIRMELEAHNTVLGLTAILWRYMSVEAVQHIKFGMVKTVLY